MAKPEKNEVQTVQGGAVTDQRPDFLKKGTGRGAENVGKEDLIIPRLELVQALSPARDKNHAEFIPGADEGMLYNSVTRELYGEEVTVVPAMYVKEWLIWKDRKKGGGFRGAYPSEAEARAVIAGLHDQDPEDDPADFDAIDTGQMYCLLILPTGKVQQIVVSMSKTKMKVARKWNSLIALSDDDSFAKAYKVSSVQEANKKGEKYYNLHVAPAGYVTEAIYMAAEKMYEAVKSGTVKADTKGLDREETPVAAGEY
jgi:hypothetical protein